MPELTSSLTYAELTAIFQDHADYDLVDSVARARVFIQAGRMILAWGMKRTSQAGRGEEVELAPEVVERLVSAAISWLRCRNLASEEPRSLGVAADWRDI